ncbi:lysyl oxidase family protein [Streptomyces capparidis]
MIVGAASLGLIAAGTAAFGAPGYGGRDAEGPSLKLVVASKSVTVDRWAEEPGVYLDLGTYVAVDGAPLEIRVKRASYDAPVTAVQVLHEKDGSTREKPLPAGLVKDFSGLPGFLEVAVKDAKGKDVVRTAQTFCPNAPSGRIHPDAPATSKFPEGCSTNPFTLGSVWGAEKGWGVNTVQDYWTKPLDLKPGTYTARVNVAKKYRDAFGMKNQYGTVKVVVRKGQEERGRSAPAAGIRDAHPHALPRDGHAAHRGHASHAADHHGHGPGGRTWHEVRPGLLAAKERPEGEPTTPTGPKPDLRALPAWEIQTSRPEPGDRKKREYLQFSATVWNAGPAPLVVDGFRKPGKGLMDAYQYFYDADGKQVGYAPTGTMEWDPREGHEHWHFTDFASYRLLKADKKEIVRSQKEAFCLANTDAVDYTVENAKWRPENTDLSTACGEESSISVREVLDVGSGDTYVQSLPGQSFDITDLPNGTYYIQVLANPEKRLFETDTANNESLRKITLSGKPGAHTVKVAPVGKITAP